MPMQHGFKFTIKGEVFIPRESNSAAHVVDAINAADEAFAAVKAALADVPATFTLGDVVAASRQTPELSTGPADE